MLGKPKHKTKERPNKLNINQLKQSRYLSQGDVGTGVLVTIKGVTQENVGLEGEPEKLRWVMTFAEAEKGLVLNSTNGQLIASFLKSDESDNWIGHKIVLFNDPTISFGGKLVGGIRVRAPRGQAAAASKPIFQAKPVQEPPPEASDPSGEQDPF